MNFFPSFIEPLNVALENAQPALPRGKLFGGQTMNQLFGKLILSGDALLSDRNGLSCQF